MASYPDPPQPPQTYEDDKGPTRGPPEDPAKRAERLKKLREKGPSRSDDLSVELPIPMG